LNTGGTKGGRQKETRVGGKKRLRCGESQNKQTCHGPPGKKKPLPLVLGGSGKEQRGVLGCSNRGDGIFGGRAERKWQAPMGKLREKDAQITGLRRGTRER